MKTMKYTTFLTAAGFLHALAAALCGADDARPAGVAQSEFVFEKAPFRECHASTIAETKHGLVAAWFGGTAERMPDVGIWLSRREKGRWTAPAEVVNGVETPDKRYPCWNPVLFQPSGGPLLLFYKVGPNPQRWWGMLMTSNDAGRTWSKPRRLPDGIVGPIKNKPVELADGTLLCPSSTEDHGWRVHFERTIDLGKTWQTTGPVNDGRRIEAIQPAILRHAGGRLQAIGRTQQAKLFTIDSTDGGKTWGPMTLLDVPNPNSGIDAVTLADGRHLLVYNPTPRGRTPLSVALSTDGKTWKPALTLEDTPGEYSYPAVIETGDGLIHITYTWKRQRIKHVAIDSFRATVGRTGRVARSCRGEPIHSRPPAPACSIDPVRRH
jgi:predicted neuraminidase